MKTLHFTNAYHTTSGGIRTFYEALLRDAMVNEREVVLVVPGAHDGVEHLNRFARVYTVKAPPARFIDSRYRLILPYRYLVPRLGGIWRILADERPDLVEICDKYALCYLAGILRKLPGPRPVLVGLSCERMD